MIRLKFLAMVVSSTIGGKNVDRHEYGHRQMNGNKRAFHYQHSGRTQHKDQRQRDKKIEQGPLYPHPFAIGQLGRIKDIGVATSRP